MQKIILAGVCLVLIACSIMNGFFKRKNKITSDHTKITITGHTQNIEGHAAVIANSTDVYFVEGMNEWEKEWLDHTVKITGDLAVPGSGMMENKRAGNNSPEKIIRTAVVMLLNNEPEYNY